MQRPCPCLVLLLATATLERRRQLTEIAFLSRGSTWGSSCPNPNIPGGRHSQGEGGVGSEDEAHAQSPPFPHTAPPQSQATSCLLLVGGGLLSSLTFNLTLTLHPAPTLHPLLESRPDGIPLASTN